VNDRVEILKNAHSRSFTQVMFTAVNTGGEMHARVPPLSTAHFHRRTRAVNAGCLNRVLVLGYRPMGYFLYPNPLVFISAVVDYS